LVSPDIAPPALSADLLRLHSALTQRDLWHALRVLARNALPSTSVTLEVDRTAEGAALRTYRHGHPIPSRDARTLEHPAQGWLLQNPGVRAFRLSDIVSLRELRSTPFFDRVMRREGWDKQLSIVLGGREPPTAA
jgi:hypothetical protein